MKAQCTCGQQFSFEGQPGESVSCPACGRTYRLTRSDAGQLRLQAQTRQAAAPEPAGREEPAAPVGAGVGIPFGCLPGRVCYNR